VVSFHRNRWYPFTEIGGILSPKYPYNNDNANSGIGSYSTDDMPGQNDINNMINNIDLPKVERK
jgi:hypothetical protein